MKKNYKQHLSKINTLIFDVDGVLTNGYVTVMPDGELVRQMNIKDGYALRTATSVGLRICVISGGNNKGVKVRLKNLGIQEIFMGVNDKIKYYNKLAAKYDFQVVFGRSWYSRHSSLVLASRRDSSVCSNRASCQGLVEVV